MKSYTLDIPQFEYPKSFEKIVELIWSISIFGICLTAIRPPNYTKACKPVIPVGN